MAGLEGREDALVRTLAGGWKQRLALGCAILHRPPVLFLDEPTSGVEPEARRRFWELIHHLASDGVTILVSTHYMEEAEYCNRIALINAGQLVAAGGPGELRRRELGGVLFEMECAAAGAALPALQRGAGRDRRDDLRRQAARAAARRRSGRRFATVTRSAKHRGPDRRAPSRQAWRTCSCNSSPGRTHAGPAA